MAEKKVKVDFEINQTGNLAEGAKAIEKAVKGLSEDASKSIQKLKAELEYTRSSEGRKVSSEMETLKKQIEEVRDPSATRRSRASSSTVQTLRGDLEYARSSEGRQSFMEQKRLQKELQNAQDPKTISQRVGEHGTNFIKGGTSGLIAGAGAVGVGIMALQKAAEKAAETINIMGDSSQTVAAKNESLWKATVPFYETLTKLRDAMDGTADKFRIIGENYKRSQIERQGMTNFQAGAFEQQDMQAGNAARIRSFGIGMDRWTGGSINRSDAFGQIQYGEAGQRLAGRDAVVQAQREAQIARDRANRSAIDAGGVGANGQPGGTGRYDIGVMMAGTNFSRADAEYQREKERQNRPGASATGRDKNNLAELANKRAEAQLALEQRQREGLEAQKKAQQDVAAAVEAEGKARQAVIEQQKIELSLLEQKEKRMESAQQRLGAMTEGEFQQASDSAAWIKEHGIENATREMRQEAGAIDPTFLHNREVGAGADRAAQVEQLLGDEAGTGRDFANGQNLQQVREQQDAIKQQLRDATEANQKKIAEDVAQGVFQFSAGILTALQEALKTSLDAFKIELERVAANLAAGGA